MGRVTVRIIHGDCRDVLPTLPAASVHCCVTSPPYWGLRDYGVDGQIGLEPTLHEWVAETVAVFREVSRVLRPDGTLWINLGDGYVGRRPPESLKPKDMLMMPARVALALQADGWWLRSQIVWAKRNPMPESVADRPTKSHELIYLLSKSATYYYDAEAIKDPASEGTHERRGKTPVAGWATGPGDHSAVGHAKVKNGTRKLADEGYGIKNNASFDGAMAAMPEWRNKRDVWTVAAQPFSEAHFATFPPALIEPCILAGCPEGGTVLDPFGGAGTTGLVADRLGRNALLIELNAEYTAMAERRIRRDAPLFADVR